LLDRQQEIETKGHETAMEMNVIDNGSSRRRQPVPSLVSTEQLDPLKAMPGLDGATMWYDFRNLAVEGKGWADTLSFYDRLPAWAKGKAPGDVWVLGHCTAGFGGYFSTDAPAVQVRWTLLNDALAMLHMPATGVSGIDLYIREKNGPWRYFNNGRPETSVNAMTFSPPPGCECLLYLPLYNGVKSVSIGIPRECSIRTPAAESLKRRKTVVYYGTSIVQGGCVSRPGMSPTAIMARALDVNIINLGFSGCGRMELEMADVLGELDPEVYIVDCLWNLLAPEFVAARAEPFLKALRAARPTAPILLPEDSNFQGVSPTPRGLVLRQAIERLEAAGVKGLYFLPNHGMLGDDGEGTVDGVHPNDLGMTRMTGVLTSALAKVMGM
jgi:hypothetical protein